jgi:hypothetical protein
LLKPEWWVLKGGAQSVLSLSNVSSFSDTLIILSGYTIW